MFHVLANNALFDGSLSLGTGVNVYSLHPGVIRTELVRHLLPNMALWKRILAMPIFIMIKSPREGAQTTIYCAVDDSLANSSGLYYRQVTSAGTLT